MPAATILIVDDDALLRHALAARFGDEGYDVVEAATAAEATDAISPDVDLALLDFHLPDGDGLSILKTLKERSPDTVVIMMTAFSSVENAVAAMKLGAFHYVNKPFDLDEISLLARQALETTRLRREVRAIRGNQRREYGLDAVIGDSPTMQRVKALLARIAASPASTVLLTGETGTG
jgi:DNA-binding NtrC family response regulator